MTDEELIELKKEDLVDRYIKALVNNPQNAVVKVNHYAKIIINDNVNHNIESFDTKHKWQADLYNKDLWELMPIGFSPEEVKVSNTVVESVTLSNGDVIKVGDEVEKTDNGHYASCSQGDRGIVTAILHSASFSVNGHTGCGPNWWKKVVKTDSVKPNPKTNPFARLNIGDTITAEELNTWCGKGNNWIISDNFNSISSFRGDRTIIGFDYVSETKVFQVSGTSDDGYIKADGFEAWLNTFRAEKEQVSVKPTIDLDQWLRDTKAMNLSLDALSEHINGDKTTTEIYKFLDGIYSRDKAKVLFDKWNPKVESIPEYVECISIEHGWVCDVNKGSIWKTDAYDYGGYRIVWSDGSGQTTEGKEHCFKPSTLEAYKEYLISEAKRRYPIGTKFKLPLDREAVTTVNIKPPYWNKDNTIIWNGNGHGQLFYDGKWSEVVSLPKVEEPFNYVSTLPDLLVGKGLYEKIVHDSSHIVYDKQKQSLVEAMIPHQREYDKAMAGINRYFGGVDPYFSSKVPSNSIFQEPVLIKSKQKKSKLIIINQ